MPGSGHDDVPLVRDLSYSMIGINENR